MASISMTRFCAAFFLLSCCLHASGMMMMPGMLSIHGKGGGPLSRDLPFAGNGTCEEPETSNDGVTRVRCLGPEQPMLPGTTLDAYILLANPYPVGKEVTVLRQEAQMIAKAGHKSWRPVPLSELYLHHVVPNPEFLQGEGAEVRGSTLRKEFPAPYAYVVNGSRTDEYDIRLTNIQLVNTKGVKLENLQMSYECWCDSEPTFGGSSRNATRGSLFCCTQRPTSSSDSYETYQLEYNVTFRDVKKEDKKVAPLGIDSTGGKVEYNIVEPLGPGTNHTMVREVRIDEVCPQTEEMEIVRCTAHQHIGSKGLIVSNAEDGTVICVSKPIYGTEKGVPGNELDYVVAISDDDLSPPYKIKPGTKVRVESVYDGSQKRLGVMGIAGIWFHTPHDTKCNPFQPQATAGVDGVTVA